MKWLALFFALLAGPVLADVAGPGGTVIECYCTDSTGGRVEMGEEICLFVGGRAFMARCEMSLNNPIWRDTGKTCVHSFLDRLKALQPILEPGGVHARI